MDAVKLTVLPRCAFWDTGHRTNGLIGKAGGGFTIWTRRVGKGKKEHS